VLRRQKFYLGLYIFIFLAIASIVLIYFASTGLDVKTTYFTDDGKGMLEIKLKNNSTHVMENVDVINNNTKVFFVEAIMPGEEKIYNLELSDSVNNLYVKAENHLAFEKTVTVNLPDGDNAVQSSLTYSVKYDTFVVGLQNNIEIGVCNYGDSTVLDVTVLDNNFISIDKGNDQLILPKDACETAKLIVTPIDSGETTIIFKVYNSLYSKELKSKIEILK